MFFKVQIWLIEACTELKNVAESHESKHTKSGVWSHVWTRNQYGSVSLKAPLPTRRDTTLDAMLDASQAQLPNGSFASYEAASFQLLRNWTRSPLRGDLAIS